MADSVEDYNQRRFQKPEGTPDRVMVILTAPRSGSTTLFRTLRQFENVVSMPGEIDPYLKLTGNLPTTGSGDRIMRRCGANKEKDLSQLERLRNYVRYDLGNYGIDQMSGLDVFYFMKDWKRRLFLQWPDHRREIERLKLPMEVQPGTTYREISEYVLNKADFVDPAFYDFAETDRAPLFSVTKLEEPPFVQPGWRQPVESLDGKVALFKTPQSVYRPGLYRALFPDVNYSDFHFVHLKRGPAQTINGLMDGWRYQGGFFSHYIGPELDLNGYDGEWWNYDLPPGWRDYTKRDLIDVCAWQWLSAHQAIGEFWDADYRLKFEDVVQNPQRELHDLFQWFGLEPPEVDNYLPEAMTTEEPQEARWKKRENQLTEYIDNSPKIKSRMTGLGYSLDPDTWL